MKMPFSIFFKRKDLRAFFVKNELGVKNFLSYYYIIVNYNIFLLFYSFSFSIQPFVYVISRDFLE